MVALAVVTPWLPKDDLLLKNAIEAGASLESLAKGAVRFSRRFTIKELQDRWHALLYDPIISVEASARMVEFERTQSSLSSKSNKADTSKETKYSPGKRNSDSVRRCYYAMRKRIRSEPLNQGDLNFLVAPGDSCFVNGAVGPGPGPEGMMVDPVTRHYGLEDANLDDLHYVLPQVTPNCVGEFSSTQQNTLKDSIQQNIGHGGFSHIVGSNMVMDQNCPATAHTCSSKQVPGHSMLEANANSVCSSKDVLCSDFGDNAVFHSTLSECESSFHHLQYASSPPTLPDWKSIEGISVPDLPTDGLREDDIQAAPFSIPDDANAIDGGSEFAIHVKSELNDHMSCAELKNGAGCGENYLDDMFNFNSEDEMLGGKDVIDKTFLDGLSTLLNSPEDANKVEVHDAPAFREPAAADASLSHPPSKGLQETNDTSYSNVDHMGDILFQSNSESQVPAFAGTVNAQFPELHNGVICCVLNTEDPDIPDNSDVHFHSKQRVSSVLRRTQSECSNLSITGKAYGGDGTGEKGLSSIKKRVGEHPILKSVGLNGGPNCKDDDCGVTFEATGGELPDGHSNPSTGQVGVCQSRLMVKNEALEGSRIRQTGVGTVKPGQGAGLSHTQNGSGGFIQEGQTSSAIQKQKFYATDLMVVEPGGEPLFSDADEQLSESDADVPYFSDIESMILDMDLGPKDQDSFGSSEVAKYQHEDVKRAIIRLEQTALSYMQRAIASRGAFAILYGHHSKHYIKKSEVLLGRATDDVSVDIDLSREGRANKVSRRQAILKMDKDGSFSLRNLGKCSIYVNSKEINPGQTLSLLSNCVVEIRGMPFIFETNQKCVSKYLSAVAQRSEAKKLEI